MFVQLRCLQGSVPDGSGNVHEVVPDKGPCRAYCRCWPLQMQITGHVPGDMASDRDVWRAQRPGAGQLDKRSSEWVSEWLILDHTPHAYCLGLAKNVLSKLTVIWNNNLITKSTKIRLLRALVWHVATYGAEKSRMEAIETTVFLQYAWMNMVIVARSYIWSWEKQNGSDWNYWIQTSYANVDKQSTADGLGSRILERHDCSSCR